MLGSSDEEPKHTDAGHVIYLTLFSLLCVAGAGVVSGLTMAFNSIPAAKLKALCVEDGPLKGCAERVTKLMAFHHWVLVALLVTNAACVEILPLLLSGMLEIVATICISTIAVLFFGEVIPQAIFTKHAVRICGFFSYFLWMLMFVTGVVSWPVAKLLDLLVGHRGALSYQRSQISVLVKLYGNRDGRGSKADGSFASRNSAVPQGSHTAGGGEAARLLGPATAPAARKDSLQSPAVLGSTSTIPVEEEAHALDAEEIRIMWGALSLSQQTVRQIMEPALPPGRSGVVAGCFVSFDFDEPITSAVVRRAVSSGSAHFPVFRHSWDNIVGCVDVVQFLRLALPKAPMATASSCSAATKTAEETTESSGAMYRPTKVGQLIGDRPVFALSPAATLAEALLRFDEDKQYRFALVIASADRADAVSPPASMAPQDTSSLVARLSSGAVGSRKSRRSMDSSPDDREDEIHNGSLAAAGGKQLASSSPSSLLGIITLEALLQRIHETERQQSAEVQPVFVPLRQSQADERRRAAIGVRGLRTSAQILAVPSGADDLSGPRSIPSGIITVGDLHMALHHAQARRSTAHLATTSSLPRHEDAPSSAVIGGASALLTVRQPTYLVAGRSSQRRGSTLAVHADADATGPSSLRAQRPGSVSHLRMPPAFA